MAIDANNFDTIDINNATALIELHASFNNISEIDLSENTLLKVLI